LNNFIQNPESPENNFYLGTYYDNLGQTASAVSYDLRTAERTQDKVLQYECLLRAGLCFSKQGCRNTTVKGLFQHALTIQPKRPEGYFLLSRFYEREENYHDSYLIASIGEQVAEKEVDSLILNIDYPGFYGILFEKAVSSWWVGLCNESRDLFRFLKDNFEMDEIYQMSVESNLERLNDTKKDSNHNNDKNLFLINSNTKSTSWIVDNFYENPDEIRKFALEQDYLEGGLGRGFIGRRTHQQFLFPGLKERFEQIIGQKITEWESHGMNGRFQISWSGEPLVYHCDSQKWGGMIYLTPNAPYQCGTTLYAHKQTKARTYYDEGWNASWKDVPGDYHLDGTPFEPVDVFGNVYNRLVIFDASAIHAASEYFGTVPENARLWQMFFFDTE
jgi:hypothetical protein